MTNRDMIYDRMAYLGPRLGMGDLTEFVRELEGDRALLDSIEGAVRDVGDFRTKSWSSVLDLGIYRVAMYALCRALRAERFVETGVLHGLTSVFILAALLRNKTGRLVSIDLPSYPATGPANQDNFHDVLPRGCEPGWVVAAPYKEIWDLRLGRSEEVLPQVLREGEAIDFFLHDSEHTYETMRFEMDAAFPALRPGGVLVCDNIDVNTSFFDFCHEQGVLPMVFPEGGDDETCQQHIRFGMTRKENER
ncbi:class I SAM-dependent methyltransferase [Desulfocurvus sp. DL9XJH121]